jgi:hypothetical protein
VSSRKIILFIAILFLTISSSLYSQEEPKIGWKNTVTGNLNFSQSSFSNWTQGGENNWAWQLDLHGKFENNRQKSNWTTTAKISYGRTKISDQESKKSADEIRLESVFTYKVNTYVNPYFAVTGETQLTKGFDFSQSPKVEISKFLDPGYFTESAGFGFEPFKDFKTRLGVALKQTVASAFAARYSDDPETTEIEKIRSEIGAESATDFSRKLSENILFTAKLELFSNLKSFEAIDVRWDNVFSAKVSKYIGVSFNFKLLYDRDISLKRQIKQVLGVGVTYSFL